MQKKYSFYLSALGKIIIFLLVVCSILWVCLGDVSLFKPFDFEYFSLQYGWVQLVDDDTIPITSLEDVVQNNSGEGLVFETTLPELSRDRLFFLYTENQEVWVYVEDELIYSFETQDALSILNTPGSLWNRVPIATEMGGQTLRLVLKSSFNPDHRTLHTAYLIHENEAPGLMLQQQGLLTLAAFILFALAIISYLNAHIWRKQATQHYLIRLADLYLFIALWLFGELNLYDLIFHRPALSYLLSMLALRILPIVFHQFVSFSLPRRYRAITALGALVWVNLIVTCLLQFVFGISFISLLTLNNCVIGLGALVCIGVIVHCALTSKWDKEVDYFFVAALIPILCTMVDVGSYYLQNNRSVLIGMFTAVGFALYTTWAHIFLVQKEADTKIEKKQLEKHVQKLETTTLMEQIKAHFIFNTLNTISALCKIDAKQADNAVNLFARYLRSYMYLINQHNNIPFERDIEIVLAYMEIEKLRFGDDVSFYLQTPFTDFSLPPLTMQPLVENAVLHGLRRASRKGTVTIQSRREGDNAIVTVTDDGAGFDVDAMSSDSSIGLANLKKRIPLMTGGTISVASQPDHGTVVTITIPLQGDAL